MHEPLPDSRLTQTYSRNKGKIKKSLEGEGRGDAKHAVL